MTMKSKSRFFLPMAGILILILLGPGSVCAQSVSLPTAQFTASITQGTIPLVVTFTGTSISSGTTSYKWEFINTAGVVTSTSAAKNPVVTYTTTGDKTVKLTVTNASGSDTEIKTNIIHVVSKSESTPSSTVVTSPDTTDSMKRSTSSSSITVTSPMGGELLKRGTTQTITWDYTGQCRTECEDCALKRRHQCRYHQEQLADWQQWKRFLLLADVIVRDRGDGQRLYGQCPEYQPAQRTGYQQ